MMMLGMNFSFSLLPIAWPDIRLQACLCQAGSPCSLRRISSGVQQYPLHLRAWSGGIRMHFVAYKHSCVHTHCQQQICMICQPSDKGANHLLQTCTSSSISRQLRTMELRIAGQILPPSSFKTMLSTNRGSCAIGLCMDGRHVNLIELSLHTLCGIVRHTHQLRCEWCRRYSHAQVTFESQTQPSCCPPRGSSLSEKRSTSIKLRLNIEHQRRVMQAQIHHQAPSCKASSA